MNRPRFLTVMLATVALSAAGSLAGARPHDDDRKNKQGREREGQVQRPPRARISLDEAVARAERRFNARVVRAESQTSDAGVVYVLRLLNDSGRVWTVRVDAASGAMY
jgi:uncharacterized membrane protein YkoI